MSMKFEVQTRLLVLLLATTTGGTSQRLTGFTPPDARDFEKALAHYFEDHADLVNREKTRFAYTLRILPAFGQEQQLNILYDFDRRAEVTISTLDKSLGTALNDFAHRNQRLPNPKELAALVRSEELSFGIESHLARRWLADLWQALSRVGGSAAAIALRGEKKGEVEVALDPTMYVIEYTDVDKYFKMSLTGPDPNRVDSTRGLDPLVKWMIDVRRQCQALQQKNRTR